jgi:hypothetical protein
MSCLVQGGAIKTSNGRKLSPHKEPVVAVEVQYVEPRRIEAIEQPRDGKYALPANIMRGSRQVSACVSGARWGRTHRDHLDLVASRHEVLSQTINEDIDSPGLTTWDRKGRLKDTDFHGV